jgi:hypothetical protein
MCRQAGSGLEFYKRVSRRERGEWPEGHLYCSGRGHDTVEAGHSNPAEVAWLPPISDTTVYSPQAFEVLRTVLAAHLSFRVLLHPQDPQQLPRVVPLTPHRATAPHATRPRSYKPHGFRARCRQCWCRHMRYHLAERVGRREGRDGDNR